MNKGTPKDSRTDYIRSDSVQYTRELNQRSYCPQWVHGNGMSKNNYRRRVELETRSDGIATILVKMTNNRNFTGSNVWGTLMD